MYNINLPNYIQLLKTNVAEKSLKYDIEYLILLKFSKKSIAERAWYVCTYVLFFCGCISPGDGIKPAD